MKLFAKIAAAALLLIGSSQISRAADTYTPNCRIVQMPTGSNDTLWGTKANAAFAMLDQCISQGSIISVTGGNVTLTTANNAADQARSAIIAFTGTPGVTRTITMPNVSKLTWVANSSNSSLIFTAGAGTTATVISGATALIYTDAATNAVALMNVASSAQAILAAGLGSAASQSSSAFLATANNLSDLTNTATARTQLGLGTAATQASSAFDASGAASAAQAGAIAASMQRASNGSDIANAATFRTNLGLDQAATKGVTNNALSIVAMVNGATSGQVVYMSDANGTISPAGFTYQNVMLKSDNLAGITNAGTARNNLQLGNLAIRVETVSTSAPSGISNNGDIWLQY